MSFCLFKKKKNLNIIFASVQYSLNGYILHIFNTENILIYKIFTTKKFTVWSREVAAAAMKLNN